MKKHLLFFLTFLLFINCSSQETKKKEMHQYIAEVISDYEYRLQLYNGKIEFEKGNAEFDESEKNSAFISKIVLYDSLTINNHLDHYFSQFEYYQNEKSVNFRINTNSDLSSLVSIDPFYEDYFFTEPQYIVRQIIFEDNTKISVNDTLKSGTYTNSKLIKKIKEIALEIDFQFLKIAQLNFDQNNNVQKFKGKSIYLTKLSDKEVQLILPEEVEESIVGINAFHKNGKTLHRNFHTSSTGFSDERIKELIEFYKKTDLLIDKNHFSNEDDFEEYIIKNVPLERRSSDKNITKFENKYYADVDKIELFISENKKNKYQKTIKIKLNYF